MAQTFSEAFADAGPRPHYVALLRRLNEIGPEELEERARRIDSIFRATGITFAVAGREEGLERTWPMDIVPRIIPAHEWDVIEAGLIQRVDALNRFLDDLYVGGQEIIGDGIVPRWLVESADGYLREAHGIPATKGARCVVAGIDLVRDAEGTYRVLEDNLRVPSGVSYVLENRLVMKRVLPTAFAHHAVRPVNHYGKLLLDALTSIAPPAAGDPTVVVLTPGVANSAYFEHAFLARQMGVELVEGRDLVVEDHVVYLRTTEGLSRVDVVYRRVNDEFLDPVVFRPDSMLGVPGLMAAARANNVTIANAVGNGAADDKAVYAYVPDMIRYYLGAEPILPNVTTYLPWDPDQREMVLDRLDQLVVKPVARVRRVRHRHRVAGVRSGARRDRRRRLRQPEGLRGPGGRPAVHLPDAGRRGAPASPRRPAALRAQRGADRGDPRRSHQGRPARGLAHRQLLTGRRLQGHLGARPRRVAAGESATG